MKTVNEALQGPAGKDLVESYKLQVLRAYIVVGNDPSEALRLCQPEPPVQLAATETPALRKLTQGKAYFYNGDLSQAMASLTEARTIASSTSPQLQSKIAFMQGYVVKRQKGDDAAEQYYRDALAFARQSKDKVIETDSLINLGMILMDREQYDEAITELSAALKHSRSLPVDHWAEATALGNLGWSYYELGDFDQATSFLKDAKAAAAQAGRRANEERWTTDLGDVYLSEKDYSQAEKYYLMGNSVAISNSNWYWSALALDNLALLELSRNDIRKAEEYDRQLMETAKRVADQYVHSLCAVTTAELAMHHNQFSHAERPLLNVIADAKQRPSLLRRAQSDLARVYVALRRPADADRQYRAAIHTVESARAAVKQEERRMSIFDGWPFYDEYIHFLVGEGNNGKALQIAEHSRSRTLVEGLKTSETKEPEASVPDLSILRVQNLLRRQHKTILAYWLAEEESYLWVVTPTQVMIRHLPPKREIEQEVQAYTRKLLAHGGIDDSAQGQKLYDLLVRPAYKLIPNGSQVIIIPYGSLYKLNFETLVVPGAKPHYWIDDVTVETAGSMVLLANSQPKRSDTSPSLLLIGAPVQASSEFDVLVHAEEEIQKVVTHFPPKLERIISKEAATPSAYKSNKPDQFTYIHFVTHGTASETNPLDSAIILSPQAENVFRLYARDIVGVPLKAEVVTISACYGAGKKAYSGEGLVGLAWAFLRAGAHQVVAGLWEVDDRATPDLMDDFYTGLKDVGAAAALRLAKLKMVHSEGVYRFPYYWASLQLYTGS
ncbi:MAG TPA: CHAT domain-containing tetratricopeptide repeat protein [Candidatus Angelobacter sp.]